MEILKIFKNLGNFGKFTIFQSIKNREIVNRNFAVTASVAYYSQQENPNRAPYIIPGPYNVTEIIAKRAEAPGTRISPRRTAAVTNQPDTRTLIKSSTGRSPRVENNGNLENSQKNGKFWEIHHF